MQKLFKLFCCLAPCDSASFRCNHDQFVPVELRCDNIRDCRDGSDEEGCGKKTLLKLF